jgi:hypothetical protein
MLPGRSASVVGGQHHRCLLEAAGRLRSLAGMAALHRPPALLATTDVHAEANTLYTRLWDVRLILVEDFALDDRASAARAFRRQLPFQRLVDRRRNGTMASPSVAGTFLRFHYAKQIQREFVVSPAGEIARRMQWAPAGTWN